MHIQINLYFPLHLDADDTTHGLNERMSRVNEQIHAAIVDTSSYAAGGGSILATEKDAEQEGMIIATYDVQSA